MKYLTITFSVDGWVEQEIKLNTDEYTPEQVVEMLEAREVLTSISAPGLLVLVKDGQCKEIGEVVNYTREDGSLFDYELERSWDAD